MLFPNLLSWSSELGMCVGKGRRWRLRLNVLPSEQPS
jgi:hypothetical protein